MYKSQKNYLNGQVNGQQKFNWNERNCQNIENYVSLMNIFHI